LLLMKLLYIITEDWFFTSHFLDRAVAAKSRGFDVAVVTRSRNDTSRIESHGISVMPIEFSRHGLNPIRELTTVRQLRRAIRTYKPDIVHNIALKPIVLGTIAARTCRIHNIVNAPVGMGYIFSSHDRKAKILRPFIRQIFRMFLNPIGSRVIIENQDDFESLVSSHFVRRNDLVLIKGAGVDTGDVDYGNPTTLERSQLEEWSREGIVSWKGHVNDISAILSASHIVCLPSYREGLPKSLIEALAAGRAVVATNVPGCREVVINEHNGLLVEPRNPQALAIALQRLIADKDLRIRFGITGRIRAEHEFSATRINDQTLDVYESLVET